MPSMSPVISAIFDELSLISVIVATTRPTTSLPRVATSEALAASVLACCAFSAFCFTVEVNSSMLDAVSSSEAACSSVREDKSTLPEAISLEPVAILSADSRTCPMSLTRLDCIAAMEASTLPPGADSPPATMPRSPSAMRRVTSDRTAGSAPRARVMLRVISQAARIAAMTVAMQMPNSNARCVAYNSLARCTFAPARVSV